jgi:hypothetical protein
MTEPDENLDATCSGRPIKAVMYPFSIDFLAGCEKFQKLSNTSSDSQDIRIFNAACIVNAACFLEAKLNQEIAITRLYLEEGSDQRIRFDQIKEQEKQLSLKDKWNLIVSETGGSKWDSGVDPFQSFAIIASLRNELVHFKGDLLGRDEAPTKKIEALMKSLEVKSQSTWMEDDCSSWVTDLLSEKSLAAWIWEKIRLFNDKYHTLVHGKS